MKFRWLIVLALALTGCNPYNRGYNDGLRYCADQMEQIRKTLEKAKTHLDSYKEDCEEQKQELNNCREALIQR